MTKFTITGKTRSYLVLLRHRPNHTFPVYEVLVNGVVIGSSITKPDWFSCEAMWSRHHTTVGEAADRAMAKVQEQNARIGSRAVLARRRGR